MGEGGKEGGRRRKREGNEEANNSVCQTPYLKFIISLRERGGGGMPSDKAKPVTSFNSTAAHVVDRVNSCT